jgi:membrane fusion protein (multidrug efflux system)
MWPAVTEAWDDVELSSSTEGIVEWIGPREGEPVDAGEPICRVETEQLLAGLAQARSAAEFAKIQHERTLTLAEDGTAPREELDLRRNAVAQTEAALAIARDSVRLATVVSPIDGVVERLDVDVGERLSLGTPVARVVNMDRLKVLVAVPERDIFFVKEGDAVEITADGLPDYVFPGTVSRVARVADPVTRTFRVEVEVPNPQGYGRAGLLCRGTFVRRREEKAIVIPLFAMMRRGIDLVAFVEQDGLARRRVLTPGSFQGEQIEIRSGLQPGDRLIVLGQRELIDGQPVTIVEEPIEGPGEDASTVAYQEGVEP